MLKFFPFDILHSLLDIHYSFWFRLYLVFIKKEIYLKD